MNELDVLDAIEAETERDLKAARDALTARLGGVIRSYPKTALTAGAITGTLAGVVLGRPGSASEPAPRPSTRVARRAVAMATRATLAALI